MIHVDWNNLAQVIAYAMRLGHGMVVVKHDNRPNYNITHATRRDLWDKPSVQVMFRT